ncbi:hypothetical protein [Streptomyces sp. NPDC057580]|uniref:hypothetical protein n=1 Tax=Streptomyces sp. NPDC057580 TaxID=3346173 RepID=UPI00367682DF
MNPTDEQTAAADAFRTGDHLTLQAGADTGKTTLLEMLARSTPRGGRTATEATQGIRRWVAPQPFAGP